WKQQHWRAPGLWDDIEPDRTYLILRMVSLLPDETIRALDARFGPSFRKLSETQRLALATAHIEGKLTHARLRSICSVHSHDLSKELAELVRRGFLESAGETRGT